jgi:hypothetical protein
MVGRFARAELLTGLNALTHVGVAGNLSDAQLLDRFLARGGEAAEAAFEALVAGMDGWSSMSAATSCAIPTTRRTPSRPRFWS